MAKQTTGQTPNELEVLNTKLLELTKQLKSKTSVARSQERQIKALSAEIEALKKEVNTVNDQATKAVIDTIQKYADLKLKVSGIGLSSEGSGTWCLSTPNSQCPPLKGGFLTT
ncbi:MAG: hypothetical protein AAF927_08695 [Bacteroidota bacterium]